MLNEIRKSTYLFVFAIIIPLVGCNATSELDVNSRSESSKGAERVSDEDIEKTAQFLGVTPAEFKAASEAQIDQWLKVRMNQDETQATPYTGAMSSTDANSKNEDRNSLSFASVILQESESSRACSMTLTNIGVTFAGSTCSLDGSLSCFWVPNCQASYTSTCPGGGSCGAPFNFNGSSIHTGRDSYCNGATEIFCRAVCEQQRYAGVCAFLMPRPGSAHCSGVTTPQRSTNCQ